VCREAGEKGFAERDIQGTALKEGGFLFLKVADEAILFIE
jgi:hypothetical protein